MRPAALLLLSYESLCRALFFGIELTQVCLHLVRVEIFHNAYLVRAFSLVPQDVF